MSTNHHHVLWLWLCSQKFTLSPPKMVNRGNDTSGWGTPSGQFAYFIIVGLLLFLPAILSLDQSSRRWWTIRMHTFVLVMKFSVRIQAWYDGYDMCFLLTINGSNRIKAGIQYRVLKFDANCRWVALEAKCQKGPTSPDSYTSSNALQEHPYRIFEKSCHPSLDL